MGMRAYGETANSQVVLAVQSVTSLASSMKGQIITLNRGRIKQFCFACTFMFYFGIIIIFAAVRIVQNLIGK